MINKLRWWLTSTWLPERAAAAVYQEVGEMQRRLELAADELEDARRENDLLKAYIRGLERNLRSQQVNVTVKGGAEKHDEGQHCYKQNLDAEC